MQALLNIGLLPHIHLAAHMSIVSALHMALEATASAACGDMQVQSIFFAPLGTCLVVEKPSIPS